MHRRKQITGPVAFRIICLMFSLCASAVAQVDSDGDGLPDSVETNTGIYVSKTNTGTNPNNPDTDGDNPLSPALRSGPTAGSGASLQKQIP
jgi:hypothetical protein